MRRVTRLRNPLVVYQLEHPEEIHEVLGTMECKVLVGEFESERHPDLAIYKKKLINELPTTGPGRPLPDRRHGTSV